MLNIEGLGACVDTHVYDDVLEGTLVCLISLALGAQAVFGDVLLNHLCNRVSLLVARLDMHIDNFEMLKVEVRVYWGASCGLRIWLG